MLVLMFVVKSEGPMPLVELACLPYRFIEGSFSKRRDDDALITILCASLISTKNTALLTLYEAFLLFTEDASGSCDVNAAVKRQLMYPA